MKPAVCPLSLSPLSQVVAMDDELLVGVFVKEPHTLTMEGTDKADHMMGWLMVVDTRTALLPGVVPPRNVTVTLHPSCSIVGVVAGGKGAETHCRMFCGAFLLRFYWARLKMAIHLIVKLKTKQRRKLSLISKGCCAQVALPHSTTLSIGWCMRRAAPAA